MKTGKAQLIVIACAIIISVLLFIAPKKSNVTENNSEKQEEVFDLFTGLTQEQSDKAKVYQQQLNKASVDAEKLNVLDTLINFANENRLFFISGWYTFKKCEIINKPENWFECGVFLEKLFRTGKDQNQRNKSYELALTSFENAEKFDPSNLNAKIKRGSLLVEGGSDPMKGITLLKEVVDKDPKNVQAQLALGFASVQSAQYDKAINRFNKVIETDSTQTDAFVYLANTYEMMGDTLKAISYYEIYKSKISDTLLKRELSNYIKKLKVKN